MPISGATSSLSLAKCCPEWTLSFTLIAFWEQLIYTIINIGKWSVIFYKNISLNVSYSWFDHILSKIARLLLALWVGLLMRGMREFEWQLLVKSFSMAVGSRRLILRSPTINTWSDWEVDDKISLNFIVNSGIFDLSLGCKHQ